MFFTLNLFFKRFYFFILMKYEDLTSKIINIFHGVYNELGYGFLEKVYQNAFYFALLDAGFEVEAQKKINVYFRNRLVGEYFADIVINGVILLELKAVESLTEAHERQILNYLNATDIEVGLLFNFGPKPEVKRKVFDNDKKPSFRNKF